MVKTKIYLRVLVLLYLFPFTAVSSLDGQEDYGCRWSSTLNFSFDNIKTGIGGNVSFMEKTGKKNEFKREDYFNVDEVHKRLKGSIKTIGTHNSVTAGVTLIFCDPEDDKKFVAFFEPFMNDKKTLSFLSGSSHSSRPEKIL